MTGLLTREEMHRRVDAVFDEVAGDDDAEAVAIVGDLVDNMRTHSPTEANNREIHQADVTLGFAEYAFRDAFAFGTALRNPIQRGFTGAVVVAEDDLPPVVEAAVIDGDEHARQALAEGEPDRWRDAQTTGGDRP